MLQSTYETFARKRRDLQGYLRNLRKADFSAFREEWREEEVVPREAVAGAEDGSFNYRSYKSLMLYALNAACVHYDGKLRVEDSVDIDFLFPYRYVGERLRLYMTTLEIKTALEMIGELDLLLLDGSLYSHLVAPRELYSLSRDRREEMLEYLPRIEEGRKEIVSKKIAREDGLEQDEVFFLEYVEYLYSLSLLLEKGVEKIVGVSKTSSDTRAGDNIPYMAGFEEVSSREGHSAIYERHVERRFPLYSEFFQSMVFSRFYTRMEDRKQIIMLEAPREIGLAEARDIISKMKYFSISGYPYLLRKAHSEVVIGSRDIDSFASLIGIKEKTGREFLK